jgi:hypothetical protein
MVAAFRSICLATLMVSVFGVACSRATAESGAAESVYSADATITVRIVNRSQLDAILFLVHDGTRDRLGAVTAATTSTFTVRTRSLGAGGEFVLLADPIGSKRPTSSETLRVAQGTIFTWTLETDFARGSIMVQ